MSAPLNKGAQVKGVLIFKMHIIFLTSLQNAKTAQQGKWVATIVTEANSTVAKSAEAHRNGQSAKKIGMTKICVKMKSSVMYL